MAHFMTALPVILVQTTDPGDKRTKDVHFHSTCNLYQGSHKTQVWLCFLVLSFLSAYTCAASIPDTYKSAQHCLKNLRSSIENYDSVLYTPSTNVAAHCKVMSLRCYMLELVMVIHEKELLDKNTECIMDFSETLPEHESVDCPPCEANSNNITIFLKNLNGLLEYMTVQHLD
ncbi:uncharacterized protein V6R79_010081 [Siganus canaliculatus]